MVIQAYTEAASRGQSVTHGVIVEWIMDGAMFISGWNKVLRIKYSLYAEQGGFEGCVYPFGLQPRILVCETSLHLFAP